MWTGPYGIKYENEGRERAGGDLLTEATLLIQSSSVANEAGQLAWVQTQEVQGSKPQEMHPGKNGE